MSQSQLHAEELSGVSFSAALSACQQRAPEQASLATAQSLIQQRRSDWLASAPSLNLDYTQGNDDLAMGDEFQLSLSTQVRLPHQQQTARSLSQSQSQLLSDEQALLGWHCAVRLQDWWWQMQRINQQQQRIKDQLSAAQQQLDWLELMVKQGERPASERLLLQQSWQALVNQSFELNQQGADLALQFEQWTGFNKLPSNWSPHLTASQSSEQPLDNHPLLANGQHQLANLRLQQQASRQQGYLPELSIGFKQLQATSTTDSANLITLGISLPLGSEGYQGRLGLATEQAGLDRTVLETRQQIERQRRIVGQQLPQLAERSEALKQLSVEAESQYQLQFQSWQQGLISGLEWLQTRHSIWAIQQQADKAQLDYLAAISQWNQLQGVIPE
ncbi:MAG: TolC family protein [Oceanobacter sp.]